MLSCTFLKTIYPVPIRLFSLCILMLSGSAAFAMDSRAYCSKVAEAAGGSYSIMEKCLKEENAAKARMASKQSSPKLAQTKKSAKESARTTNYSSRNKQADIETVKGLMTEIPPVSMKLRKCGKAEEADNLIADYAYLFDLYQSIHSNFPEPNPSIPTQVARDEKTLRALWNYEKEGASTEICENSEAGYVELNDKIRSHLREAFIYIEKNHLDIAIPAEY